MLVLLFVSILLVWGLNWVVGEGWRCEVICAPHVNCALFTASHMLTSRESLNGRYSL